MLGFEPRAASHVCKPLCYAAPPPPPLKKTLLSVFSYGSILVHSSQSSSIVSIFFQFQLHFFLRIFSFFSPFSVFSGNPTFLVQHFMNKFARVGERVSVNVCVYG